MIIGITGKSGSGKSYISEILTKKLNAKHVDIDKISHDISNEKETIEFLKENFGNEIFVENQIDRKKLGEIVFNNNQKLTLLNKFYQNQMEQILNNILNESSNTIILDYALLEWLEQFKLCNFKILVTANDETRYSRVCTREKISKDYFLKRDKSVNNYNEKLYDLIIENNNENIEVIVDKIIKELK